MIKMLAVELMQLPVEVFLIADFGYDDCPGHPVWLEPAEWLGSEKARDYPLHMISNQPRPKRPSCRRCAKA